LPLGLGGVFGSAGGAGLAPPRNRSMPTEVGAGLISLGGFGRGAMRSV
jgi:hypothetical protein